MNKWLTLLVIFAICIFIGVAIYIIIRNKKEGKGCGDCNGCPYSSSCKKNHERNK